MAETIKGPVNGATIAIDPDAGNVYWTWSADDNLDVAFKLFHHDAASTGKTTVAQGVKPSAVHVDFGLNGVAGDKLSWRILCMPLNAGTWPVYVQLFQGTEESGYRPISEVIQYDVVVGPPGAVTVSDIIEFT